MVGRKHETVRKVLKNAGLRPYSIRKVQKLKAIHRVKRVIFRYREIKLLDQFSNLLKSSRFL